MTLQEIEELLKSVNKNAYKASLRNAAILNDPKVSTEMKNQAIENIKAIAANKSVPKKSKAAIKPSAPAVAPTSSPVMPLVQKPAVATPSLPKIEYPEGLHLSPLNAGGHDETAMRGIFDALPDHEKKKVTDWHSKTKVNKSIDALYDLFTQLKKYL